jgi:two-component system, LytTR family, sensor kinase
MTHLSSSATPRGAQRADSLMGRIEGHRELAFYSLQVVGWTAYFIAQFIAGLFYPESLGPASLRGYVYVLGVAAITGFALTSLLRHAFRRLREREPASVIFVSLIAIYVAALIWRVFINRAYVIFMGAPALDGGLGDVFAGALISTYLLLSWAGLYYGIHFYEAVQRERLATVRATALAQEAQLKMLRYQLNPHFLFNTLNAISTLVLERDTAGANLAVTRLSAFLRRTLDQDPVKKVTLREELDALDLYLGIETLRFGSRLVVSRDVDPGALAALVPSLVLQPLVENALKHAISVREEGGTLLVKAQRLEDRLRLIVADDGPGFSAQSPSAEPLGVGLRNTRDRLAVLYGTQAQINSRNLDRGCEVTLDLPAEFGS